MGCSPAKMVKSQTIEDSFVGESGCNRHNDKVKSAITESINSGSMRGYFEDFEDADRELLLSKFKKVSNNPNSVIIVRHSACSLGVVTIGAVVGLNEAAEEVYRVNAGQCFGEGAFMKKKPHKLAYFALRRTTCFLLNRRDYDDIAETVSRYMAKSPLFLRIPQENREQVYSYCKLLAFKKEDIIFEAGERSVDSRLCVIVKGSITRCEDGVILYANKLNGFFEPVSRMAESDSHVWDSKYIANEATRIVSLSESGYNSKNFQSCISDFYGRTLTGSTFSNRRQASKPPMMRSRSVSSKKFRSINETPIPAQTFDKVEIRSKLDDQMGCIDCAMSSMSSIDAWDSREMGIKKLSSFLADEYPNGVQMETVSSSSSSSASLLETVTFGLAASSSKAAKALPFESRF